MTENKKPIRRYTKAPKIFNAQEKDVKKPLPKMQKKTTFSKPYTKEQGKKTIKKPYLQQTHSNKRRKPGRFSQNKT